MNIQMPTSTLSDINSQVTGNLASFGSIATIMIGLMLAFIVIEFLVDIMMKAKNNDKK